ncbi:MAG: class I SAM-dependent rRNA methyltransferase, partial [Chlamydiae bacterium]|nr:class I SAM-dependent rRNA methyltransferase [Chlamydiota bacterium]
MSQKEKAVFLRSGKERVILSNRHPWIFSGAVQKIVGSLCPGDIAPLYSHDGTFLAIAYFHPGHSLLGRVLSFERKEIADILQENLKSAYALRKSLLAEGKTNCFRLVNAEEDGLPGLIIDVYGEVFVLQISTLGMERLKPLLLDIMQRTFTFTSLYEKSTSSARALEGLERSEGLLLGQHVEEVDVREEGITFRVAILEGQKTGFFLDQREMRRRVGEISHGKKVLNCFAYTGGFSLYALRGGAVGVTSVDLCPVATRLAKE